MKKLLRTKLVDGFLVFKTKFCFWENFIVNLLLRPKKMRYAALNSFSVMNFDSTSDQASDEYLTVAQLSQRYPAFSQGSIRWLIFNSGNNGFNKVVRKIGRKVVLSLSNFLKFVEDQKQ